MITINHPIGNSFDSTCLHIVLDYIKKFSEMIESQINFITVELF